MAANPSDAMSRASGTNATSSSPSPGRRVLFLTHVGEAGGAELKMMSLCLAVQGEVLLFQNGPIEKLLEERQIPYSICAGSDVVLGVRRDAALSSLFRAAPGALSMVRDLAQKAKAFDVVVCVSQKSFVLASLAKPLMRRPIFWFMNDILSPEHFSPALIRMLTSLSRFSADQIVLNSQAGMDAWLEAGGRKQRIRIIYSGTSEKWCAAQLQDSERIEEYRRRYRPKGEALIGMFGRICSWKGQDVFLRALAQLPDVHGLIVGGALFGDEDYLEKLKALARELGVDSRVTFTGHVRDPMTHMAICNVVAHCSTAPEPFGQVISQAMLAGRPVIATDAGGAPEVVSHGKTGLLTPMKDSNALAAAIRQYLENPAWAAFVANAGKAVAEERFTDRTMNAKFLNALEAI
jgi:glycosyltransferase involved in cell wall biosynthesis